MAGRYQTKPSLPIPRDRNAAFKDQDGEIYDEPVATDIGEGQYTDLQYGGQTTSSNGAVMQVVKGKTSTRVIVAVAILFTVCVILVAFALIMAGVTLSSSQETSKDSTRSSALIQSLESQLTQLRAEFRQELNSMRSTLAVAQHSFNTSLHTLLHPYQNCYTDTTEARMPPIIGTYFTRDVVTDFLNINATVSD